MADKNVSLAGSVGKHVSFAPALKAQEALLKSAARKGYYYPMLALKQLTALSTGFTGKHNVFIPSLNDSRAHTFQMVHVYLPGIRATVERRPNDSYVVTQLELSDGYSQVGKGMDRPGIYQVEKMGEAEYQAKYKSNARIKVEDRRLVAICDGGYRDPDAAATDVHSRLREAAGPSYAALPEFDMVYSAQEQGLGKRSYDPIAIHDSYAIASITANAMIQSQKKNGVLWVSLHGGSAVLTQAMHIVAQQKITLENHIVKMYHPQTNPSPAMRLAHQIGINIDKDFVKVGGKRGLRTYCSAMLASRIRAQNPKDPYSWQDYGNDLAKGGLLSAGLASTVLLACSLPATSGAFGIGAAVTSGIGACHLLWTCAKNLLDKPKSR